MQLSTFYTQVQLRIGKAYIGLKKFKQGFIRLTRASKLPSNSQVTEDILYEMAKCYSTCGRKGKVNLKKYTC